MDSEPEILPALTPTKQFLYAGTDTAYYFSSCLSGPISGHLASPSVGLRPTFGLKAVIMLLQHMTMNDSTV